MRVPSVRVLIPVEAQNQETAKDAKLFSLPKHLREYLSVRLNQSIRDCSSIFSLRSLALCGSNKCEFDQILNFLPRSEHRSISLCEFKSVPL